MGSDTSNEFFWVDSLFVREASFLLQEEVHAVRLSPDVCPKPPGIWSVKGTASPEAKRPGAPFTEPMPRRYKEKHFLNEKLEKVHAQRGKFSFCAWTFLFFEFAQLRANRQLLRNWRTSSCSGVGANRTVIQELVNSSVVHGLVGGRAVLVEGHEHVALFQEFRNGPWRPR